MSSQSCVCGRTQRGGGTGGPEHPSPGKSQVTLCFLWNTGTDPSREPLGSNCFSREIRSALCKLSWRLKKWRNVSLVDLPFWNGRDCWHAWNAQNMKPGYRFHILRILRVGIRLYDWSVNINERMHRRKRTHRMKPGVCSIDSRLWSQGNTCE